jgi:hypothetical protein
VHCSGVMVGVGGKGIQMRNQRIVVNFLSYNDILYT